MLALVVPATASAGTYQSGCVLLDRYSCMTTGSTRLYTAHYGNAAPGTYIASWLFNPVTGVTVDKGWGFGASGGEYDGPQTTYGYWGNYSGVDNVWVLGTFEY